MTAVCQGLRQPFSCRRPRPQNTFSLARAVLETAPKANRPTRRAPFAAAPLHLGVIRRPCAHDLTGHHAGVTEPAQTSTLRPAMGHGPRCHPARHHQADHAATTGMSNLAGVPRLPRCGATTHPLAYRSFLREPWMGVVRCGPARVRRQRYRLTTSRREGAGGRAPRTGRYASPHPRRWPAGSPARLAHRTERGSRTSAPQRHIDRRRSLPRPQPSSSHNLCPAPPPMRRNSVTHGECLTDSFSRASCPPADKPSERSCAPVRSTVRSRVDASLPWSRRPRRRPPRHRPGPHVSSV